MARGKIQIRRIDNRTNRQVTYSKRRNGLFKKATELSVLCDAKVFIIMFSSTDKLHEFISPGISKKQFIDLYQKTEGVDIWSTCYEKMQRELNMLQDVNEDLRRQIRQRMGDCLNDTNSSDLFSLEEEMENTLRVIRERKVKVLKSKIDRFRRKVKHQEDVQRNLLHEFEVREEEAQYGVVETGYHSSVVPRMFALRLDPGHQTAPLLRTTTGPSPSHSHLTTYTLLG